MLRHSLLFIALFTAIVTISLTAGFAQKSDDEGTKLPEGKGRDLVASVCAQCHGLELTTSGERTLDEWKSVVNDMVSNGAALQEDEVETVSQYLGKNFSPDSKKSKEGEEKKQEKDDSAKSKADTKKGKAE
jgi:mono/diheme cytochrome c family protein